MGTLCLNLVIRDGDAAVLDRCLAAYLPHVDAVALVDTDPTGEAGPRARALLAGQAKPWLAVERPYRGAAQARNAALDIARTAGFGTSHLLLADPATELVVSDPAFRSLLVADCHSLPLDGPPRVDVPAVLRLTAPARFRGVASEWLDGAGAAVPLPGVRLRRLDLPEAVRTARRDLDIRLMRDALRVEHDGLMRARYAFYLGNAHRAAGDLAEARRRYLQRARMGQWEEEAYCARLYAARCAEGLGLPADLVLEEYAALNNERPDRAEAMHAVIRLCRENGWWEEAYATAAAAFGSYDPPAGLLFPEDWIYDWGLLDELAVASYWTGRHAESLQICEILLAGMLPPDEVARVRLNRDFAERALRAAGPAEDVAGGPAPAAAQEGEWRPSASA